MAHEEVKGQATATAVGGSERFVSTLWRLVAVTSATLVDNRWRLAKVALITAAVLAGLALHWGAEAAFLLGLLAASVSRLIDARLSVLAGLLCIASCPLLLLVEKNAWLEQSALVSYYVAGAGIYNLRAVADMMPTW